ncbi:hypothetical protein ACLBXM_08635 [Xanthobacteraceae bacterium A53D]
MIPTISASRAILAPVAVLLLSGQPAEAQDQFRQQCLAENPPSPRRNEMQMSACIERKKLEYKTQKSKAGSPAARPSQTKSP